MFVPIKPGCKPTARVLMAKAGSQKLENARTAIVTV